MHDAEPTDATTGHTSRASERGVRASDAEREATAKVLRRHYAEGRLDHGEYEERIDRCYAAKRVGLLDELTFDLPRDDAAQEPASRHPQRDDRPAWREGTAARLRAAIVATDAPAVAKTPRRGGHHGDGAVVRHPRRGHRHRGTRPAVPGHRAGGW